MWNILVRRAPRLVALMSAIVLGSVSSASAQSLPASCTTFTDPMIQAGLTTVKAEHVVELRVCINELRARVALPAASWTDPALTPQQTWIRAAHIAELRAALSAVYVAGGSASPSYTDPTLTAQATPVRAVHLTELRTLAGSAPVAPPCPTCPPVTVAYYHTDALGSVRAVTDATGAVVRRHDYYPFGEEYAAPPVSADRPRFTGKERDLETGLDYFAARYYGSRIGRFTTVDPVFSAVARPQRWNRYAYALNNPLRFIDPSGLDAEDATEWNPGFTSGFDESFDDWIDGYYEERARRDAESSHTSAKLRVVAVGYPIALVARSVLTRVLGRFGFGIATGIPIALQWSKALQNPRLAALTVQARRLYPNLAGRFQDHHIWPKYLGGPANGPTWRIDAAYHQLITNEFRNAWPYGGVPPSTAEAQRIMREIYSKYPLW
jgi:RHS repeat-associated protein